jgi:hypothetical protein
MLSNEEKIQILIDKINNINGDIKLYIERSESLKDKYSLDEVLPPCYFKKSFLLQELEKIGGSWTEPLTNQQ